MMTDQIELAQKVGQCEMSITRIMFRSRPYVETPLGKTTPIDYAQEYRECITQYGNAPRCESIFQQSKKQFCKIKSQKELAKDVLQNTSELPPNNDPLYVKKREEAKAQSVQAEAATEKVKLKNKEIQSKQEAISALVLQAPVTVSSTLELLKKARGTIQDKKLKEKKELAEQRKQAEQEKQSTTQNNIERSISSYSYPLVP
jgi:hypothetical protein